MFRQRVIFIVCSSLVLLLLQCFVSTLLTFGSNQTRTALVIGNGAYTSAPLNNPVNDARDIASVLKERGFIVIYRENADRSQMRSAIREFEDILAKKGGTGLFYFAGHGVQLQGENYLVPIGADIQREYEVPDQTIKADLVLKAMAYANNDLNIVIFDACRNNPFPRSFRSASRGLARMKTMGSGMLIAYATSPGSVASDGDGKNGIYTKHLLQAMETPGLSIEQVFKSVRQGVMQETNNNQTPWEESSLTGDFYFIATDNARITVNQPSKQVNITSNVQDEKELTFWRGISSSKNVEDYEEYLQQYPEGVFAELAKNRIESFASLSSNKKEIVEYAGLNGHLLGRWQLDYFENNKKNYLLFSFDSKGVGNAEAEEPDGSWWAEPITWNLEKHVIELQYKEGLEKYTIEVIDKSNLVLLCILGDDKGERFTMKKVHANEPGIVLQAHDSSLIGIWKDTWEENGKSVYQQFTLNKDGSALDQGKTSDDRWSEKGSWRVEDKNKLVVTSDGSSQRYRIVHVTPDYLDIIDLSPEYNGIGSRLKRVD